MRFNLLTRQLSNLSVVILICLFAFVVYAEDEQSIEYWQQTIQDNPENARAWFNIGVLYEQGQGVKANKVKARKFYNKAIELGHAPAMFNLGSIYAQQKDYARARDLWLKAAELNVPEAQYNLAMLYEKGWGVEKDPQSAATWYQKAAETAMKKYYELYQQSREVLKNYPEYNNSSVSIYDNYSVSKIAATVENVTISQPVITDSRDDSTNTPAAIQVANTETAPQQQDKIVNPGWVWVYQQPRDHFTIQLFATKEEDKPEKFIQKYALVGKTQVIPAIVKGTKYYKVILGSFSEWNDAAVEIGTLPQDLRDQRPWVRKFATLYPELPEGIETSPEPVVTGSTEQKMPDTEETAPAEAVSKTETVAGQDASEPETESAEATQDQETGSASEPEAADANTQSEEQIAKLESSSDEIQATEQPQQSSGADNKSDVFDNVYTQQQLASKGLKPEVVEQLKIGLDSIQTKDYDQAIEQLSPLADAGLPEAQYHMALLYSQGEGVAQDSKQAYELMKNAAEQGHPYAQLELARFYSQGIGVETNASLGSYWMQTAEDNLKRLNNQ